MFKLPLQLASIVKDATDEVRHVAGHAIVGTTKLAIEGTGSVLKASLGDETSEAIAKMIEKAGGDVWQALLDYFAPGEDTQEAVNWIVHLLADKLRADKMTFNFFFKRNKPLAVILMLIFKAHSLEHQSLSMTFKPLKFKTEEFEELKRLSRFCINVYRAVDDERPEEYKDRTAREIMEMLDEDEILLLCNEDLHLQDGKNRCPRFMVFTDTRSESIVVAIRGTNTMSDVVIDIVCVETDFLGGKAHQGMADATMEILEYIQDTLRTALEKYPGFKLFITGHSLGGGVGTLMTMAIRAGKIQDYVPSDVPLMCKVFAPPPVFFSETEMTHLTSDIESYVQGDDCVPRFSLGNTAELFAMIGAVDSTNLNVLSTIKILKGEQDAKTIKLLKKLNENMRLARNGAKMQKYCQLQLSGRVFYITESDYGTPEFHPRVFEVTRQFIDDAFLVLDKMIEDHKGNAYKNVFDRIKYD